MAETVSPVAAQPTAAAGPSEGRSRFEVFTYDDRTVRWFVVATTLWGFIGMLVGAVIALQLAWPEANVGPYFTFGRRSTTARSGSARPGCSRTP